jgi:hypothetical protein
MRAAQIAGVVTGIALLFGLEGNVCGGVNWSHCLLANDLPWSVRGGILAFGAIAVWILVRRERAKNPRRRERE